MPRDVAAMDPSLLAVLVVAGFFIVWFFVGGGWNRRLARKLANETRHCLVGWGGASKVQAFGTTAFRMTTEGANPPFRDLSIIVTLQPREMPLNWALARAQGRRDAAVLEASLRTTPRFGFELVDPSTRIGRRRAQAKSAWSTWAGADGRFLLSSKNERAAGELLESLGPAVLAGLTALHVTAGSEPGMVASLALEPGQVSTVLTGLRGLAVTMTASGTGFPR